MDSLARGFGGRGCFVSFNTKTGGRCATGSICTVSDSCIKCFLRILQRMCIRDPNLRRRGVRNRSHVPYSRTSEPRNIQPCSAKPVMPLNRKSLRNTVEPKTSTTPHDQRSIRKLFHRPPLIAKHAARMPNAPATTSDVATCSGSTGTNGTCNSPWAIQPRIPRAKENRPRPKFTAIASISNNLRMRRIIGAKGSNNPGIQAPCLMVATNLGSTFASCQTAAGSPEEHSRRST